MQKQFILSGDPKEVDKVIRENRIRINRGLITIAPVEPEVSSDEYLDGKYPEVIDDKEITVADTKKPRRSKKSE